MSLAGSLSGMLQRLTPQQVMKFDFPRVSRARLKVIDEKSSEIGDGTTTAPTEEERAWLDIMGSQNPELERLRKRLSVCATAEIADYSKEAVTVIYDGIRYTIRKPVNGLRIARARESSRMSAFEELNAQRQIVVGLNPLAKDFSGVDAEVIQLLAAVADDFFFVPYL